MEIFTSKFQNKVSMQVSMITSRDKHLSLIQGIYCSLRMSLVLLYLLITNMFELIILLYVNTDYRKHHITN